MQITVTSDNGGVFPLDVGSEMTLQDLQALVELETRIPRSELLLVHNMAPMLEALRTLDSYGVQDGDIVMASRVEGGVALINPATPKEEMAPVSRIYRIAGNF